MPKTNYQYCFNDSCMCGADDCPYCHPENVPDLDREEDITEEEEEGNFHD